MLLLADEPTTALDVTIQAQILDLIRSLSEEFGTAVILITHDLGIAAGMCHRVNVMYAGRIVETGIVDDVFEQSRHPYAWGLLDSLPRLAEAPRACERSRECRRTSSTPRPNADSRRAAYARIAAGPRPHLTRPGSSRCFGTASGWIP
jgi:ABC-type dipeptide/oligopeptide/nickel transport system ATPase component